MEYHEKAHWEEAAKYHILDNPRMTNSHFDWDNKEVFDLEEIRLIALAGIKFDIKNNIAWLLLGLLEPLTIPFFILTMMFGNAIPVKFSERSATDGYWYLHSNEFTSF